MASAATTGRITLALAAAALVGGCGEDGPVRNAAGKITQSGETRLLKLRVGDCATNLRERLDNPDGANNGVPKVTAVNCARKHDAELLLKAPFSEKEWPGFQIVDGEAARGRLQLAVRLARAKQAGNSIRVVSFRPTRERWNFEGQRAIYYLALYEQGKRGHTPR